jgi:GNAT superfamily N-acetyltransferase
VDRYHIRELTPDEVRAGAEDLAAVLVDCVAGGASVNFMAGYDMPRARAFWRGVADRGEQDGRVVIAATARGSGRIVGTVQMIPANIDNQPHRADIAKMLVHRDARRQGLGGALMAAAEAAARRTGKSLLTLDTASDEAFRLYSAAGFIHFGRVPGYALLPDGTPCHADFFYKVL